MIVRAALESIDRHGSQGLTMRGLGQQLGVEAMSLYRYVSGREDLLEAVVAMLLEDIHVDSDDRLGGTWQGYLQALAHSVRRSRWTIPPRFRSWRRAIPPPPGCDHPYGVWNWSRTFSRP